MVRRQYDVLIVGGSYADLGATPAPGWSIRHVPGIDTGKPAYWQTPPDFGPETAKPGQPYQPLPTSR